MFLHFLTFFCLTVFAANSIFCRFSVMVYDMGPLHYTGVRSLSAALILALLCVFGVIRPAEAADKKAGQNDGPADGAQACARPCSRTQVFRDAWKDSSWPGAIFLFLYMVSFSLGYVAMPSAPGTLILNICVIFGMVGWGLVHSIYPNKKQYCGFVIAGTGLGILLFPGLTAPPLFHALLMGISGFAWSGFTICGRSARSAALAIAGTFWRAAVFGGICMILGLLLEESMRLEALLFALAGGLASSLGYILWYAIVPRYTYMVITIVQLAIPAITAVLGALFLSESITLRLVAASVLILGGIGLAMTSQPPVPQRKAQQVPAGQGE